MSHVSKIVPRLSRRKCGGFLALSPESEPLKLGAVGPTELAATEAFYRIFAACKNDLLAGSSR